MERCPTSLRLPRAAIGAAMLAAIVSLAGCTASDTKAPEPPRAETAAPAVTRRPIESPAPSVAPAAPATAPLAIEVPPDALYVCVVQRDGKTQQTAIEYAPKVGELCRRHPEMGPCQYERNNCRARGGRVFATGNVEITLQTEAEYDKKVMRTRFRAN